ncbi:MAG TPA: hypothetical protein EYQ64_10685, partial [Gemmatimonadetes bacterium]|nr:hypothetical protein [Gemmatimonadota bacterium]
MGSVRMTQVTALVLKSVAAGYRYGFDVMEACDLPSGTAYPALRRLEKAGLLKSRWEKAGVAHAEGRPRRTSVHREGSTRFRRPSGSCRRYVAFSRIYLPLRRSTRDAGAIDLDSTCLSPGARRRTATLGRGVARRARRERRVYETRMACVGRRMGSRPI